MDTFNHVEYSIMTGNTGTPDELYRQYLVGNYSGIEHRRVNCANIRDFLREISNSNKYTAEQVCSNLKDCLHGRRACLVSCGDNINDYKSRFPELKDIPDMTVCVYKSACKYLDSDIFGFGGEYYNGGYAPNDDSFKVFVEDIAMPRAHRELNPHLIIPCIGDQLFIDIDSNITDKCSLRGNRFGHTSVYNFIMFIVYLGIKELYMFGMHLSEYGINLAKYTYEDLIIKGKGHYYDMRDARMKETGYFFDHINSYYIADWARAKGIRLYNVSNRGCISNRIERVKFEHIYDGKSTDVHFDKAHAPDFVVQFKDLLDPEYYSKKYNVVQDMDAIVCDYLVRGIYLMFKLNSEHSVQPIILDEETRELVTLFYVVGMERCDSDMLYGYFRNHIIRFERCMGLNYHKSAAEYKKDTLDRKMLTKEFKSKKQEIAEYLEKQTRYGIYKENVYIKYYIYRRLGYRSV